MTRLLDDAGSDLARQALSVEPLATNCVRRSDVMGKLDGKVALVTGGASGIGAGCAQRLAEEGATVVITDVQDVKGGETVAAIEKAGGKARFLHHDVTSEDVWAGIV